MSAMRQAEGESASIGAMDAKDHAPQPPGRPAPSKIPFSAFASLAHEAILILDATQHITFANSAAEATMNNTLAVDCTVSRAASISASISGDSLPVR